MLNFIPLTFDDGSDNDNDRDNLSSDKGNGNDNGPRSNMEVDNKMDRDICSNRNTDKDHNTVHDKVVPLPVHNTMACLENDRIWVTPLLCPD